MNDRAPAGARQSTQERREVIPVFQINLHNREGLVRTEQRSDEEGAIKCACDWSMNIANWATVVQDGEPFGDTVGGDFVYRQ